MPHIKLSRRSFLFGSAALVAASQFPGVSGDYVVYPHETWGREFDVCAFKHVTKWRAFDPDDKRLTDGTTFAMGCMLSDEDIVDGKAHKVIAMYNRMLENVRCKYDFPREIVYRGAREHKAVRWAKIGGAWRPGSSEALAITGFV